MNDDVERSVLGATSVRYTQGAQRVYLVRLGPGRVLLTVHDAESPKLRRLLMDDLERIVLECESVTIYVDLRSASRVASGDREEWVRFGIRHRHRLARIVVLVRSRLVEMAMSVMGLFVGGSLVSSFTDEDAFITEIRRAVPSFRGLPALDAAPTRAARGPVP